MKHVDKLRGLYARSPRWLRNSAASLLALVPPEISYGGTYRSTLALIQRAQVDADFIDSFRRGAMASLFRDCLTKDCFYTDRIAELSGDGISDANALEMLKQMPITTKETLRDHVERFLIKPKSHMDLVSTGGTSGVPLAFWLDKDRGVKEWAFVNHLWARIGYRPSARRGVLRGILFENGDIKPWEYEPALRELRLSPFQMTEENMSLYLRLIEKYQVEFLHGYPSALTMLANFIKATGQMRPSRLRGILPVSEALYPHQRELLLEVFEGVRIQPFYGMSEKVAIAGEVPNEPDTYDFEPLYGITELVDDDGHTITTQGIEGRIVSTGLLCTGMPLLRYDTGDRATLVRVASNDNAYRLYLRDIRGRRAQEYLVSSNNSLISMTAINIHSPLLANIKEFQFHQDKIGQATFKAVPMEGKSTDDLRPIIDEMQAKVGPNLALHLEIVNELPYTGRGKRSFIEQMLPIHQI